MEKEISAFNVIHWESNMTQQNKPSRVEFEAGVTGGWLNNVAILLIRWRILCYEENKLSIHFVCEDKYTVPNVKEFNENKMKTLLLKSLENVNHELNVRTDLEGVIFIEPSLTESLIITFNKAFLEALNVK